MQLPGTAQVGRVDGQLSRPTSVRRPWNPDEGVAADRGDHDAVRDRRGSLRSAAAARYLHLTSDNTGAWK